MGSRRSYGNRRRFGTNTTAIMRPITFPGTTVLPQMLKTQFKMAARLNLDYIASTGVTSVLNLQANSLYDPLSAEGSIQPPMFDAMMSFYQRYEVTSCKIKITATNTTDAGVLIYCIPMTDTSDTYTFDTAICMPGAKHTALGPIQGSPSIVRLSNYGVTKNILGVAHDTNYQGSPVSNPSRLWLWRISSTPMYAGLSSDYVVNLWIEFIFYCILSDPSVVANS